MKVRETLSEAARNLVSGTSRALSLALMLTVVVTTIGLTEGSVVSRLLTEAAQFRSSGASIVVLSAEDAIDGAACERLAGVEGIVRSGAIRNSPIGMELAALPDAPVPVKEATPGFGQMLNVVLGQSDSTGIFISEQVSMVAAYDLGKALWTSRGRVDVAGVYSYPADGRSPLLEYAAVRTVLTHGQGRFDQCWAEVWPTNQETSQLLRLSLDSSVRRDTEVVLSQLNTTLGADFNGGERFRSRATSTAAVVSVLVGLALGYVAVRLRRLELASARHAGVSGISQLLQLAVETSVWVAAAVVISMPALLYQTLDVNGSVNFAVLCLQVRCALGAAAGTIVGAMAATALTRERHLFRYFRER